MRAFQDGDAQGFEKLLSRHQKGIYNFCLRMLSTPSAAEDATQDIFLKVVKSAPRWKRTAKVSTWVYTIARNHCIDALRKAKHRKTTSLDQPLRDGEGTTLGDRTPDQESVTPDRGAESARLQSKLAAALASLSDEQREVFVMREQGGMAFREIAEVVGVPENTVKSRMRYALDHLRRHLAEQGITPKAMK